MPTTDLTRLDQTDAADPQRIEAIAKSINLQDPSLTIYYGGDAMRDISRFSDDMLSRVRSKDAGEIGATLTDLMLQVKSMDLSSLDGENKGFLEKLPVIGGLFNSAERSLAQFDTVKGHVDIIGKKLEDAMVGLLRDIEVLEQLYNHNRTLHNDLVVYIEAGKERLEQARNEELPALQAKAEASGDNMDAQAVRDFSDKINRFERKLFDLQTSRAITLQTAPQIRLMQNNDQTLAEKIQTSLLSTIPIWKSQLVLALSLQNQRGAAQVQKKVTDTTNDLLKKNADMLQQSTIETAREVERTAVDIGTLRHVHEKLIATIEETLRIAQEGRAQRVEAEKELAGMEQDLRQKLTTLNVAKDNAGIEAAAGDRQTRPVQSEQPGQAIPHNPENKG